MALWDNFGLGDLPKGWAGDVTSAYATQLQYSYFFMYYFIALLHVQICLKKKLERVVGLNGEDALSVCENGLNLLET